MHVSEENIVFIEIINVKRETVLHGLPNPALLMKV